MRSVLRLTVLVGMLVALGVAPAQAQTLDQQQTDTSGGGISIVPRIGWAQSFIPDLTGTLDRVDLFLDRVGAPPVPLTVEIRDVVQGNLCHTANIGAIPGATVLATATIPAESVPVVADWVTVNFVPPASVVAGTQYAIVVHGGPVNLPGGSYRWYRSPEGTNPYTDGNPFSAPDWPPPVWCPSTQFDFAFRTYVTEAPYNGNGIIEVEALRLSGRTLSFRMIAPTKVRFTLDRRTAPKRYRRVGSFVRKARRGRNRVRIPRRLNGRRVKKGVYRLSARTVGGGIPSGPVTRRIVRLR